MGRAWARCGCTATARRFLRTFRRRCRRMKVLVAHNFYQQPGGEDQVFRSELALLESRGHEPLAFEMHNDTVTGMGRLALFGATIWNRSAAGRLRAIIRANAIELVHFHNTF